MDIFEIRYAASFLKYNQPFYALNVNLYNGAHIKAKRKLYRLESFLWLKYKSKGGQPIDI